MTSSDVRKQRFRKTVWGYDREEVETFLEMVADELEKACQERAALEDQMKRLQGNMREYEGT